MEEGRSAFKILTGTPAGKRPLGRPTCRWQDNIRIDLKEIGINIRNWKDGKGKYRTTDIMKIGIIKRDSSNQ